jgi:uncharacterized protein YaaQ
MSTEAKVKLVITIVRDSDANAVIDRLIAERCRVTRVASTGGFLRKGNVTLLIGVEDPRVQFVIDVLREVCCPPDPGQHRATVFVVDAAHFEQI